MERLSDGVLVGVVSFGIYGDRTDPQKCAKTEYPQAFARVAFARDWIKNVTKI
jgi:secreted trypsin-like serine protease